VRLDCDHGKLSFKAEASDSGSSSSSSSSPAAAAAAATAEPDWTMNVPAREELYPVCILSIIGSQITLVSTACEDDEGFVK
jgi:hypothetical protein